MRKLAQIAQLQTPKITQPIYLNGYIPGVGKVSLRFSSAKGRTWEAYNYDSNNAPVKDTSALALLRGDIKLPNGRVEPVAAAVFEVDRKLTLQLRLRGGRKNPQASYYFISSVLSYTGKSGNPVAKVKRMPGYYMKKVPFDIEHADASTLPVSSLPLSAATSSSVSSGDLSTLSTQANTTIRVLNLTTVADASYSQVYGSSVNNQIASLVEATNIIYVRDLSFKLKIVSQVADPAGALSAVSFNSLLENFALNNINSESLAAADIYHMFTARTLTTSGGGATSVVGLADVGTACQYQGGYTAAYGFSKNTHPSYNHLILAHEIGHNLGAEHDSATQPPSLMFPSADPDQSYLSNTSITQINANFAKPSTSCLGGFETTSGSTPTPTPTTGASATPSPTATSSANPTPTPTTGGGGSGSGGSTGGAVVPNVAIGSILNAQGGFAISVVLSNAAPSGCVANLVSAKDSQFSKRLPTLFTTTSNTNGFNVSGVISRKAQKDKTGKALVYVRAEYSCPGVPVFLSTGTKINAAKVRSSRSALSISKWVSAAKKTLKQS